MNTSLLTEWLPPIVYRSLRGLNYELKFLLFAHKELLHKNLKLKGVAKGKRAFLLATGPSIKQENLKLLAGEDCFSISNFFLHGDIQLINPVFQGFAPYHKEMILETYIENLQQADQALPPRTKIVLGHQTYDMVQQFGLFPGREVFYLYLAPCASGRQINLLRPVVGLQTGSILLLPLMIYMGYERIYLLGCDNNRIRDYNKTNSNFYPPELDIRKDFKSIWIHGIEAEFGGYLIMFDQYKYYQNIIKGISTSIINLSVDSWLEMFPFDRLENII
ncbi:MAG: hypothetical protein WBV23_07095, partial [Desulfobaccales bacterium]